MMDTGDPEQCRRKRRLFLLAASILGGLVILLWYDENVALDFASSVKYKTTTVTGRGDFLRTLSPITAPPVTVPPITAPPVTVPPIIAPPITSPPITAAPISAAPITGAPTAAPVSAAPATANPTTGVAATLNSTAPLESNSSSITSRTRIYQGDLKLVPGVHFNQTFPLLAKVCNAWAVVTTAKEPSEAVKVAAKLKDYCLVIVGDMYTPANYLTNAGLDGRDDVVYLSAKEQRKINHPFVDMIPSWQPGARKNIGYLFAIRHGAKVIFDFDDDTILKPNGVSDDEPLSPFALLTLTLETTNLRYVDDKERYLDGKPYNPYPYMHPNVIGAWPRGFPKESLEDPFLNGSKSEIRGGSIPVSSIGVIQSVCDNYPGVDVTYQKINPLPFAFNDSPGATNLLVPVKSFAPYNSQATVHMYNAFWGLLLPMNVPSPIADIWRSYVTQRIFQDLNLALLFSPPKVKRTSSNNTHMDIDGDNDWNLKMSHLLNFLSQWDDPETYLPARLEKLCIALYERGYIEMLDVDAIQQWLIALLSAGYKFPTISRDNQNSRLEVTAQPLLRDQPFLAFPHWNLGGPQGDLLYAQYLQNAGPSVSSQTAWDAWLADGSTNNSKVLRTGPLHGRPDQLVIKLVMMTKNEWPLLKKWTLYHGELLGFENLYIIDGSTDPRCIAFLKQARDELGAQVIFSPANLNELNTEMNVIGSAVQGSSDFLIKIDTDEFLAAKTNETKCDADASSEAGVDCTLKPMAVRDFLVDVHESLSQADGRRHRIGWMQNSLASKELCDASRGEEVELLPLGEVARAEGFKAVMDSRSFQGFDLGGHIGFLLPPHEEKEDLYTRLGIIHFHSRCYEQEVELARQVITSHGYISDTDSASDALDKLKQYMEEDLCVTPETCTIASCHKVWLYVHDLACRDEMLAKYYNEGSSHGKTNPDFQFYFKETAAKYPTVV